MKLKNLLQHELIGLSCTIVKSKNSHQIGLNGIVVDETMRTVSLETGKGIKKILKQGSVLRIDLRDKKILLEGSYLVARPEDRIKKKVRTW